MAVSRRVVIQTGLVGTISSALTGCATSRDAGGARFGEQSTTALGLHGTVMDLWPGSPPGGERVTAIQSEVVRSNDDPTLAIINTTTPTVTVFQPKTPTGASLLVIPGGGYQRVAIGKEGYAIANWLVNEGITVFVLLYRLPADGWSAGPDAPLQDAQRAIRLIRRHAPQFALDAGRVGVMGFSAGGHLAARLATRFDLVTYVQTDEADTLAPRPDIVALGYPVISFKDGVAHLGSRTKMLGPHPDPERIMAYSAEVDVPSKTAPCFLMCAADDPVVPVENSLLMLQSLRRANVPATLHVFEGGGHGFGLQSDRDRTVSAWGTLFLDWCRQHRFI